MRTSDRSIYQQLKWLFLPTLALFCACGTPSGQPPAGATGKTDSLPAPPAPQQDTATTALYASDLRTDIKVPLGKVFTDTVTFVSFNDDGDYFLCQVRKGQQTISLVYDELADHRPDLLRGDTIEIRWRMDSIRVAGDGESLQFTEWLSSARKIKDSRIAAFRKRYPQLIKYWYSGTDNFSDAFKDELYRIVEYYLAYSKQELVTLYTQHAGEAAFAYSIEEREREGRHYLVLGVYNDRKGQSAILQWLYLDSETHMLYEYDLAHDKLIAFP